jgi:hypothetical protein
MFRRGDAVIEAARLIANVARREREAWGGRNDADQHLTHPGEVVFRNARNIVLEGYRVEAARLALSLGPHDGLAQVQEP